MSVSRTALSIALDVPHVSQVPLLALAQRGLDHLIDDVRLVRPESDNRAACCAGRTPTGGVGKLVDHALHEPKTVRLGQGK